MFDNNFFAIWANITKYIYKDKDIQRRGMVAWAAGYAESKKKKLGKSLQVFWIFKNNGLERELMEEPMILFYSKR